MLVSHRADSIDRVLLEKGLLTPEQLTQALHYQCRLSPGQEMSLAEVVVAMEFVSESALKAALGDDAPEEDLLLQALIKEGAVQEDQLQLALQIRNEMHLEKRVGTVLLEMGQATKDTIESALKQYYQKSGVKPLAAAPAEPAQTQAPPPKPDDTAELALPIGQRLILKGYISQDELKDALDYQQRLPRMLHKPLGEIMVELGYLSRSQLEEVLAETPAQRPLSLGDILVKTRVLQPWQLSHAMAMLDLPEHAGKKFGHLIVELGYARRPEIEAALKDYYARNPIK
jgi:hypothetical protein